LNRLNYFVAFSFFTLLSCPVSASYIQMGVTTVTPTIIKSDAFEVNVSVQNTGDETAHDVTLSLGLPPGFDHEPVFVGPLPINTPYEAVFEVSVQEGLLQGSYPLVVYLNYADANSYQFSSVSPTIIRYARATTSKLRGSISDAELTASGETDLVLNVGNSDYKAHSVNVRLNLPNELATENYQRQITVEPAKMKELKLPIKSFGALAGSNYLVFASLEYEEDNMHYSFIASGKVAVVEKKTSLPFSVPFVALLVLAVVLIYSQLRK